MPKDQKWSLLKENGLELDFLTTWTFFLGLGGKLVIPITSLIQNSSQIDITLASEFQNSNNILNRNSPINPFSRKGGYESSEARPSYVGSETDSFENLKYEPIYGCYGDYTDYTEYTE